MGPGHRAFAQVQAAGVAQAPAPRAESPSPVHTPFVDQAAPDDPPGYRAEVQAHARRYVDLYYSANLRDALAAARAGLALAEARSSPRDEAEFLKATGYVSWLLGDSAATAGYGRRLLALADRLDDHGLRSVAHRLLASVYRQTGDKTRQREHTDSAVVHARQSGNERLYYGALNLQGVLAFTEGRYGEATRIHEEILAHRLATGNRWDAAGSLTNLADVATAQGEFERALRLHEEAYALRVAEKDARGQMRSLRQIAGVLRRLGRSDEALARLRSAIEMTERISGHELLGDLWTEIALTHEARGELAEALAAERRAHAERSELAGERAQTRLAELEARFELAEKQKQIDLLARESQLKDARLQLQDATLSAARQQRTGLLVAGLLGAVGVAALVRSQRLKLKAERAARDAAEHAHRLKTRLLSIASHDLRNPLGNIQFLANEVRDDPQPAAPGDERLGIIAGEAQRLLVFVQDLIDTAALEVGRLELQKTSLDLDEAVRAVRTEFLWQARLKEQTLAYVGPVTPLPPVDGDRQRLHQVFSNLIGNAIKFTPAGKTITLSLAVEERWAVLRVRDEGPGLSAADASQLFQPFSRLAAKPTGGESSHGLGLSIAHDLVRLHGGEIAVESPPGGGATFIVRLPLG